MLCTFFLLTLYKVFKGLHIPLGPSSLSMGNGPRGTAPGPFPLIVILRGGAVPPNSGAVPPPLYITIRGNGPGAVPPGPFPMDKLDGPSGMLLNN